MLTPRDPPAFPPLWTSSWGCDRYGLWAEFELSGSIQRLRWIEPGEFLMGSPDDEPERFTNEGPRHSVRLTQGFWLADTACTQALWQSVLGGKGPSYFSDALNRPVEQVNVGDVEEFLVALSYALGNGAQAALPTEAQWEYACRAGTTTPFNFGANITPEKANYDSNLPYAGGVKGPYRGRTVPVRSLPANSWGLYEMHGNVWEWCADNMRPYPALALDLPQVDPQGALNSTDRVLRGGAWLYFAKGLRSAYRTQFWRGSRAPSVGFRLSLKP